MDVKPGLPEGWLPVRSASDMSLDRLSRAGETASKMPWDADLMPKEPQSIEDLEAMISEVLTPILERYGSFLLTHGFTSHEVIKKIKSRIAPELDQHAASEKDHKGKQICKRGGCSVDLIHPSKSTLEIARFIISDLPFDRLYFYAEDKPIHVSHNVCGNVGSIVRFDVGKHGNRVPRVVKAL